MLCCTLFPTRLTCADSGPQFDNQGSAHQTVRDLEMKIEVKDNSRVVQFTITNNSPEMRHLRITQDLTLFRVNLTDEKGAALKMTAKGTKELTEPAIGSVGLIELKRGEPSRKAIDLAPLFEFPQRGAIR